jgi:hypothetical protein
MQNLKVLLMEEAMVVGEIIIIKALLLVVEAQIEVVVAEVVADSI